MAAIINWVAIWKAGSQTKVYTVTEIDSKESSA